MAQMVGDGWSKAAAKIFNICQMLIPSLIGVWLSENWGTAWQREKTRYHGRTRKKYHRRNKNTDLGWRKKGEANIAETAPERDAKLQRREGSSDQAIRLIPKLTMPLSPEQKANLTARL